MYYYEYQYTRYYSFDDSYTRDDSSFLALYLFFDVFFRLSKLFFFFLLLGFTVAVFPCHNIYSC